MSNYFVLSVLAAAVQAYSELSRYTVTSESEVSVPQQDVLSESHIKSQYFKFVAEYGKAYASREEHDQKYGVFKDNFIKIEEHNTYVDDQGRPAPFTMGVNEFSDMTEQEFVEQRIGGAKIPSRKLRRNLGTSESCIDDCEGIGWDAAYEDADGNMMIEDLPEYKNWFEEGMVTRPYDQGGCGSCWAFTTASTLESLAMITGTEPKGKLQEYSVQQLVDCDEQNFVCAGGWMYEAYQYTEEHGIELRGDYAKYRPRKGTCRQGNGFHYKNTGQQEWDGMANVEMRRQVLRQPIGVGIYATGMLQSYRSGIVTEEFLHCSAAGNDVNHGVAVVGFGRHHDEKTRGHCDHYWIIRNSWGRNWGEKGFFKLCADNPFSEDLPFGTCHVNEFGTWPTIEQ